MTENDKAGFVAALTELALLKNAKLVPEAFAAWWNAMREWPLAEFCAACAQLNRESQYMPNPYHFENLRKALRPTVGESWARAREHARSLPVSGGFLQERPSGDSLLDAAVRAVGGYKAIASSTERDLQFIEQRFAEHFEQIGDAVETREALPRLRGPQPIAKLLGAQ